MVHADFGFRSMTAASIRIKPRRTNRSRIAAHGTTCTKLSFENKSSLLRFRCPSSALRAMTSVLVVLALMASPVHAARKQGPAAHNLSLESVNNAEWRGGNISTPLLVKLAGLARPRSRLAR